MINVIDEVLSGEPKYRVMNENNVIIHDNVKIEMITPVTTAGTPINKVLFDSIYSDFNKLKLATTYTNAVSTNITSDTNNAPLIEFGDVQEKGTGRVSSEVMEAVSGYYDPPDFINIFDKDDSTYCFLYSSTGSYSGIGSPFFTIEMLKTNLPICRVEVRMSTPSSNTYRVVGHNTSDITKGVVLGTLTVSSASTATYTFNITNTNVYKYYSFTQTNNDNKRYIYFFKMYENNYYQNMTLANADYKSYTTGDIIKIKTATIDDKCRGKGKININNLGMKDISDAVLSSNSYVTLVYDGLKFRGKKDI